MICGMIGVMLLNGCSLGWVFRLLGFAGVVGWWLLWLVRHLVGRFVGCLASCLVDCLVGWVFRCLVHVGLCLVFAGWLVGLFVG